MRLFKQFLIGNLIGIALVFVVALLATTAHCAVGNKKFQGNALGFVQYETNPYMYLAGALSTDGNAVADVDGNLSLRIRPTGTYMLYDENILLCGLPTDKFTGVSEEFVITYERVSHHTVQGVGCHQLLRVDSIKKKEIQ